MGGGVGPVRDIPGRGAECDRATPLAGGDATAVGVRAAAFALRGGVAKCAGSTTAAAAADGSGTVPAAAGVCDCDTAAAALAAAADRDMAGPADAARPSAAAVDALDDAARIAAAMSEHADGAADAAASAAGVAVLFARTAIAAATLAVAAASDAAAVTCARVSPVAPRWSGGLRTLPVREAGDISAGEDGDARAARTAAVGGRDGPRPVNASGDGVGAVGEVAAVGDVCLKFERGEGGGCVERRCADVGHGRPGRG